MKYRTEVFLHRTCDKGNVISGVILLILTFAVKILYTDPSEGMGMLLVLVFFGLLMIVIGLCGAMRADAKARKHREKIMREGKKYRATITNVQTKYRWHKVNTQDVGNDKVFKKLIQINSLDFEYYDENGNLVTDFTVGLAHVSKSLIGKQVDVYILGWETYVVPV